MNLSRSFLVFIALLLAGYDLRSQHTREDSLLKALATQKEDTTRVNTLNQLSFEFYYSNNNRSLQYAQQALKLAEKLRFTKGITGALNSIGVSYYFKGNYPEALTYYIRATKILEAEIKPNGENPHKKKLGALYNNIAAIFLTQSRYKDAEDYFNRSLQIDGELGDKLGMAQSYNNIGTIYKDLGQYEKALNFYLKSLGLSKGIIDLDGLPSTLTNIGVAYMNMHKNQMANSYLQEALSLYRKNNDSMGVALCYNDLGDLYDELKNPALAAVYYDSCLAIAIKNSYLSYVSYAYQSLSSVFKKQKKFEQALDYHILYMRAKDTIYNRDNADQLSQLQTQYETEKKEKELKLQASELQLKELENEEANRQKAMFRNFFILLIIFMTVFTAVLISRYKIKQKANKDLEEKNRQIALQKDIVEQKQKEILDSIQYAQRIQQSLLPNEKYLGKTLARLKNDQ